MGSDAGSDAKLPPTTEEILTALRQADISAQRAKILHGMELKLAELIGTDGDGGDFANMKAQVMKMQQELNALTLFSNRAKWTIGLLSGIGSVVATVVVLIVQHYLK